MHIHRLFFYKFVDSHNITFNNPIDTSSAIIQRNLFDQKLFKEIKNLKCFEKEIKNDEAGIFSITIPRSPKSSFYKELNLTIVTAPSPKDEGFLGLIPGHPIRGPKCFVQR